MKKILLTVVFALTLLSAKAIPYGVIYTKATGSLQVPVYVASNNASFLNLVTNALPGTIIQLAAGTFDITNTPLVIPPGVSLQGVNSNVTILRNWIRSDGHIDGRGAGLLPTSDNTIASLQITNALGQTNFQASIGAIYPQAPFDNLVTRGIWSRGSSDGFHVDQQTAFNMKWYDYGSTVTSKWDTVVLDCNDFNNPSTILFHSANSAFISVGPAASGANTAHGLYSQSDFIDYLLDGVTLSVTGNSINRSWQIDNGLEEGDSTGVFLLKNPIQIGLTLNSASLAPSTNTTLVSLDANPRNAANLINLPWASVSGAPTNFASAYAAGTAYTLTTTTTNLAFGTTSPSITIAVAGTYRLKAEVGVKYNGATYAGAQTVTFLLQRTNNTPGAIANATRAVELPVLTTFTGGDVMGIPEVYYTATAGDKIVIQGVLSASPAAGSVLADSAEITATRIY